MKRPRTLRKFIYLGNSSLKLLYELGIRVDTGHCRMILDVLRSKPEGYEWTSREIIEILDRNPQFRTATKTFRAVNWWLSKFKQVGVIQWMPVNLKDNKN